MMPPKDSATIRQAVPDDVPVLARLLVDVQEQHVAAYPRVFRSFTIVEAEAAVRATVDAGHYAVHEHGGVDGMIKWSVQVRPANLFAHAVRYVVVDELVVDASVRRRGIAQELLAWVDDRAREAGAVRVQLDTWASNAIALAAFRKAGFAACMHRQWRWLDPAAPVSPLPE